VTFPIILPGVIGAALAGFSLSYDEFARSLFTTGVDLTLPLMVMAQFDKQLTPTLYAIGTLTTGFSFLVILTCSVLFWLTRRQPGKVSAAEPAAVTAPAAAAKGRLVPQAASFNPQPMETRR